MIRIAIFAVFCMILACAPKKTICQNITPNTVPNAPIETIAPDTQSDAVAGSVSEWHGTVYFDLDRSDIRHDQQEAIAEASKAIKMANGGVARVELVGGCCPLGSDDYNALLGARRAVEVRNALGVGECRSVGESNLVTIDEAEYWRNRRCEIIVRW